MFAKLLRIYTDIQNLYAKFPSVKTDAIALWSTIETLVATKAFNSTALYASIGAAETLVSDFAANWTGAQPDLQKFEADLVALFK